jgi:hypothetical protein
MIKTQARLVGKDELRAVMWAATVEGAAPAEYCLAADVEAVQAEIAAKLRERLIDQLCERIAQRMPHLLAVDLLEIRRLYIEALAPLLERP